MALTGSSRIKSVLGDVAEKSDSLVHFSSASSGTCCLRYSGDETTYLLSIQSGEGLSAKPYADEFLDELDPDYVSGDDLPDYFLILDDLKELGTPTVYTADSSMNLEEEVENILEDDAGLEF